VEELFVKYGALAVFGGAFVEFIGLPFPSAILLLYVGALVETSLSHLGWLILLAAAGAVLADLIWYSVGRLQGERLLGLYCKVTLGSKSCTDRTRHFYLRFGVRSLLFAKFVPGFSTFAAPMAGHTRASLRQFLVWDLLGAVLWSAALLGAGHIFGRQWVGLITEEASRLSTGLSWAAIIGIAAVIVFKIVRRHRSGSANPDQLMVDEDDPAQLQIVPRESGSQDSSATEA